MTKRAWKALALAVSLVLIGGLLWTANGLVGNPVSRHLGRRGAEAYLTEHYAGTDYQLDEVSYDFKSGGYYARIVSPASPDSQFSLSLDWRGRVTWDSYQRQVAERQNTAWRLDQEYRELVKKVVESPAFPDELSIAFGSLEIYSREDLENDQAAGVPADALCSEDLVLDQVYNIPELGRQAGKLVINADRETVTPELAAELMLEIRRMMDEAGVGFRWMDFELQLPLPEEGPRPDVWICSGDFPYESITAEGLPERLEAATQAVREEYARQDAIKRAEEPDA